MTVERKKLVMLQIGSVTLLCLALYPGSLAGQTAKSSPVDETINRILLQERQLVLDPHRLAEVIRNHGVTVFQTGPSVWSVLLAQIPEFPRLRVAVSTGDAIAPDLARRLACVGKAVWNLYGPTEATVWATGYRLERDASGIAAHSSISAPIGRPLANVAVRVLDAHRVPVPSGAEGELWIGGKALARGYRNNEQLTRERFVDLGQDSGIFYQTGDVVAQDADGTLHYFGRNDDQIKIISRQLIQRPADLRR